ncbi:tRNA modification GTPase [uncultured Winogradskyella sp.]|uniref:tRNA modification GTPase n=1 Tax=uncultured Winogradskyella sp. TaxID=395353 RepID=UPI002629B5AC|nr:tRNA modification GTPase [uncultured Winogradskyella sp.]
MRYNFLVIFLIVSSSFFAQTNFEKGSFITNSNEKIECLIKNIDWKDNPIDFKYKLSESGYVKTHTIKEIKVFEIYGSSKYIRAKVEIDRSSDNIDDLSVNRNPIFKIEELFLRLVVEGKGNLYKYEDGLLNRFFYKINNNPIKQLVYKRYKIKGSVIGQNNYYRQQLLNSIKCDEINENQLGNLDYNTQDLSSLFERFNECDKSIQTVNYQKNNKKDLFNLRVKAGIASSSVSIRGANRDSRDADFENKLIFRLGAEVELLLPFNNDKWAFILEPSYQNYQAKTTVLNPINFTDDNAEVYYKTIELPIGLRHYFFLNDNSKIFLNGFYSLIFPIDSRVHYGTVLDYNIENGAAFSIGAGYMFKQFSVEFRYDSPREMLNDYPNVNADFNQVALIFGYQIF